VEQAIFVAVVLLVLAASGIASALRAKRAADISTIASRARLQYSSSDPFDCTRVGFRLFTRGDGRGAENVMWREPGDGHVYRVFDYWFYNEHRDQYGRTTKSYDRFTCAMALVGSSWPDIEIVPEGLMDKMASVIGGGDIDLESEEFNRLFAVRCADRRFASALVDPQMLDFLLSTRGELNFQLKGRWLLVWTDPIKAALMPGLLGFAEQFVARIPPVVWELYPSSFVDEDGTPLAPGDGPLERMQTELAVSKLHEESDTFNVIAHSPFEPLERTDGVEYDLDGKPLPKVNEDPWGQGRG
jgi:hypothetical protein